jgi:superfamily II DNA or RNA helicase
VAQHAASVPGPATTAPTRRRASRAPAKTTLRPWQQRAVAAMADWVDGPFLVAAAPGAGKTVPALHAARQLLRTRSIGRIAVVCPTAPLTRQWAAAAASMGLQLAPDAANLRPPAGFDGVAVTYARVAQSGARWAKQCSPGTFVIADEAHHLGDELAWGQGFNAAFATAARRLLLSGTPFRSDAAPIPGVRYDSDGIAVPDVTYSYADAVRDGVCRPVTFVPYDGVLQWQSGEETIEASFADAVHSREAARRYRTAISVELADGLPRILAAAHAKLLEIRSSGHRDAGGLIVAADSEHARAVAKVLRAVTGKPPLVVLHTEARAAEKLAAFRSGREPWIVAVNMVSEGVDIPRLRVGVYATAAKTPLIFRQIVGRFVRTIPGRGLDMSWLYLPADPVLRAHAADVENDLSPILRRLGLGDEELLDDIPDRLETEPSEAPAFVPLSADLSLTPQLALFGSPGGAPAPLPTFASAVEDPLDDPGLPAFERRALLRDKRHRLVSDLRRTDGRTHAEINAWLNRATGITRVDDASIDQLQRSIDLLLDTLSHGR